MSRYAKEKLLEKRCLRFENKLKDLSSKNLNRFLKTELKLGDTNNIWGYKLMLALIQISKDLKKYPSLRGGLFFYFMRGDLEMLEKAYKGIKIDPQHFFHIMLGVSISEMGELRIKKIESTREQLQMHFWDRELEKYMLRY